MKDQFKNKLNRRQLLDLFTKAGTVSLVGGALPGQLSLGAEGSDNKFCIYIHMGSWSGMAAGLLQPQDVGKYPRGVFYTNNNNGSSNPNINVHHKDGNLIFNNYTKVLAPISDHICFSVGNPMSIAHQVARSYQQTGGNQNSKNSAWVTGVAQALTDVYPKTGIVQATGMGGQLNAATSNVTVVSGGTTNAFRQSFEDLPQVPRGPMAEAFFTQQQEIYKTNHAYANIPNSTIVSASHAVESLSKGIPELAPNSPMIQQINTAISRARVDQVIDAEITNANDGAGVKGRAYNNLLNQLKLAAALAKGKYAQGLFVQLDLQDFHEGGADVITARSASQVFAQLNVFWQWVKSQSLQDDIMVIVGHEFSRTAYNGRRGGAMPVVSGGQQVQVVAQGKDHWPVMGMVFLNGKVPPKSRIGGIQDGYLAAGSSGLDGVPNPDIPAYSSTQLVGSMLMRVWPDIFPNEATVKKFWLGFGSNSQKPIKSIVE